VTEPLLEVADLVVRFPGPDGILRRVVDGVSLAVARGETLALVGESGSGKTTIGRAALRLIEPSAGDVRFRGRSLLGLRGRALRRVRRELQVVFQDPVASLDPRIRAWATVAEGPAIHGLWPRAERRARAVALLARVGLDLAHADRLPHELSGGERQRVAIARALAVEPSLIVLDEATSALDVSVQAQVLALLAGVKRERGLAFLFISHDLAVVELMADRVAVLRAGRVVEEGETARVLAHPEHPYTQALVAACLPPDPRAARAMAGGRGAASLDGSARKGL